MTNLLDNFRTIVTKIKNWPCWEKMNFADIGINNLLLWTIITLIGSMIVNSIIFFTFKHIINPDNYTQMARSCCVYLLMLIIPHIILMAKEFLNHDEIDWIYFWIYAIVCILGIIISPAMFSENQNGYLQLLSGTYSFATTMLITHLFGAVFENTYHDSGDIAISQIIQEIILIGSTIIMVILTV